MHPHQHRLIAVDLAFDQCDMFFVIDIIRVGDGAEFTVIGWHAHLDLARDQLLLFIAVMDQVLDADQFKVIGFGDFHQIRQPSHGSVFLDDLTDHAGRIGAAHPGQVDRRFRMTGAPQHAPLFGNQREHMARPAEVRSLGVRIHDGLNRQGTLIGRDSCRRILMVDGDGKGRPVVIGILRHHRLQIQFLCSLRRNRQADQSAPLSDHEVDHFRRRFFSQGHKVPFILPVFIVNDDNDLAPHQFVDCFFDSV
ncbi:hypothetical protein D3C81_1057480 [compost metagenome]